MKEIAHCLCGCQRIMLIFVCMDSMLTKRIFLQVEAINAGAIPALVMAISHCTGAGKLAPAAAACLTLLAASGDSIRQVFPGYQMVTLG